MARLPAVSIFDRYALSIAIRPLLVALVIGIVAPLCVRLTLFLDLALSKRSGFSTILQLIAYWIPPYLGIALPLALFIGLLIGLDRLSRDNELAAMQASGLGLHRMFRPILVLSAVTVLSSFIVTGWFAPYTIYAYRVLIKELHQAGTLLVLESGMFVRLEDRTYLVDEIERENGTFRKLFVFIDRADGGPETLTARTGRMVDTTGDDPAHLLLVDGVRLQLEAWPVVPRRDDDSPLAKSVGFETATSRVEGDREIDVPRRAEVSRREFTLDELFLSVISDKVSRNSHRMRSEYHFRMSKIYLAWLMPFIALPFATAPFRSRRYYRFALAGVIVVGMYQMLSQAELLTLRDGASPYLTTWLPLAVLSVWTFWRYWRRCFVVKRGALELLLDRAGLYLARFGNAR